MNRFIIHEGLPYSYVDGKTYAVRWDDKGFTVGAEVDLTSAPPETFDEDWPEISILAKCRDLDSIKEHEGMVEAIKTEDFERMTVAELKQFASDNSIEIKAKNKAELIEEIKIALKAVI